MPQEKNTISNLQELAKRVRQYDKDWKPDYCHRMSPIGLKTYLFFDENYYNYDYRQAELNYPKKGNEWENMLEDVRNSNNYSSLDKDDILEIIFGVFHRERVCEGYWDGIFRDGIMEKLVDRLLEVEKQ